MSYKEGTCIKWHFREIPVSHQHMSNSNMYIMCIVTNKRYLTYIGVVSIDDLCQGYMLALHRKNNGTIDTMLPSPSIQAPPSPSPSCPTPPPHTEREVYQVTPDRPPTVNYLHYLYTTSTILRSPPPVL